MNPIVQSTDGAIDVKQSEYNYVPFSYCLKNIISNVESASDQLLILKTCLEKNGKDTVYPWL